MSEKTLTQLNNKAKKEIIGAYKGSIIDTFIKKFYEHYGDSFDAQTVINGIHFDIKDTKNGISTSFDFDPTNIRFRSDIKESFKPFNENAINEFITNHDYMSGNLLQINDVKEGESMTESAKNQESESKIDNEIFIPTTSDKDRFNHFNKLNKIGGFTPKEDVGKEASVLSKNIWEKTKDKTLSNIAKKNGGQ